MSATHASMRTAIHKIVSALIPFDRLEEEHLNFAKQWIASEAEIFRLAAPDQPSIHLVSYFMVIDQHTNQLLLVDHKKAQHWLPPGGHVELNEHPKETVKREAREELGIEADFLLEDPLFLTVRNTVGTCASHTDVSLWYVLKGNAKASLNYDTAEFQQIRWFKQSEIPFEQSDPNLQRFLDKALKKLVTLNSYDVSASQYAINTEALHPQKEVQKFLEMLPSRKAKILDIGCGPGRDAKIFVEHGLDVIGIDFSSKMVEISRKNVPQGTFQLMDIESLVFPAETFDGAWANCSLLHIPKKNMPVVLKNIWTILKPNGCLYISLKQDRLDELCTPDGRYGGLEKFWSFYEENDLMTLLNESGFKIIDIEIANPTVNYQTHPLIKILAKKQ